MKPYILYYPVVVITFAIIAGHILVLLGVLLNRLRDLVFIKKLKTDSEPGFPEGSGELVSVIVAARNEEKNLPELIESLREQSDKYFEIVFINDRSTDGTETVLENIKEEMGDRVKIIVNNQDPEGCNPKQFALDLGIEEANGSILLFTDADCVVPSGWVEYYKHYFDNSRTGVVFGQLSVKDNGSFFERYQAFDQLLLHQYNSGTAGLGLLTGCFGNNLAVRREVIDAIGGFRALGYTTTEDAALLGAVNRQKKWKGRVSTLKETMIETAPQKSWKGFMSQHVRWNMGGFYADDLQSRLGYRFIVLYLVFSILLIPAAAIYPFLFIMPVTSFVFPGLLGFTGGLLYSKDRIKLLLMFIPYMLLFMVFYSLATVLAIFKVTVKWKGTVLKP